MALENIPIPPGAVTVKTDREAGARWVDMDKVRFHEGLPEKMGGWQKILATQFAGKCRGILDWVTLAGTKYIAMGTSKKLYVVTGGILYDITPIRASSTINNNPFSMTDASALVTVTDTAHGAIDGDYVTYSGATAAGGITIVGEYVIDYVDANTYTITHSAAATSTTTGGGASVVAAYQISIGADDSLYGTGYGVAGYGLGTWGTGRTTSTLLLNARTWSLDTWGEDLVACPRGGTLYAWDASTGIGTRAVAVSGAPATIKFIMVSDEDRHLLAYGAHDGSVDDPLLVRWSDTENYGTYTATETNTAGDKRLDTGNELYCAVKGKGDTVVFSGIFAWVQTFTGSPYTFGFRPLGRIGNLMGPNAVVAEGGRVFWMGSDDFYFYDGAINVLPCPVHNKVFDDRDLTQKFKVYAGIDRAFNEIWWHYCAQNSTEVDRYVIFNFVENTWAFGTLARTAFNGDPSVISVPYAAGADGYLYYHDYGTDADGSAMTTRLVSGGIEIGTGESMMRVKKIVPDFKALTGNVSLTLKSMRYPHSTDEVSATAQTISSATEYVKPRIKGRQISITIASTALSDHWRLGGLRMDVKPAGKR